MNFDQANTAETTKPFDAALRLAIAEMPLYLFSSAKAYLGEAAELIMNGQQGGRGQEEIAGLKEVAPEIAEAYQARLEQELAARPDSSMTMVDILFAHNTICLPMQHLRWQKQEDRATEIPEALRELAHDAVNLLADRVISQGLDMPTTHQRADAETVETSL